MGEQHLNLFPAAASSLIFRCRGESRGNVASIFVQITRNLAGDRIREQRALSSQTSQSFLLGFWCKRQKRGIFPANSPFAEANWDAEHG